MPVRILEFVLALGLSLIATAACAQTAYDKVVGEYMAAVHIANTCAGLAVHDEQDAGNMVRAQNGLRKQKFLRFVYYGKTVWLVQEGHTTLTARALDVSDPKRLCRFGGDVAGKNDTIGRFLYKN